MKQTQYDAIVIGVGHNGLVTAAYLAKEGLKVLVLEPWRGWEERSSTKSSPPGFNAP